MDALDAGNEYGVSLLRPKNRLWFVRMMACIRAEMLKRKVPAPEPAHFKTRKPGEAVPKDDL